MPPLTSLKLVKRDENALYFHTDDFFSSKIKTKYEFEYVGRGAISFIDRPLVKNTQLIDFLTLLKTESISLQEKLRFFMLNFLNELSQFETKIGAEKYTIIAEWYESIGPYEPFYAARTQGGLSFYTLIDGYIGFFVEVGELDNQSYFFVNYYFRYSTLPEQKIPQIDLLHFLSTMAYYFEVQSIIIYADYESCDRQNKGKLLFSGNYCIDFYNYLKFAKKGYADINIDPIEMRPKFSYYEIDRLKSANPFSVLYKDDRDELFQIYTKTYMQLVDMKKHNIGDFYIWLVDNYCLYVETLRAKMNRFYTENNPFLDDFYIFNSIAFLYNRRLISIYPMVDEGFIPHSKTTYNEMLLPKNRYRIFSKGKNLEE